MKMEKELERVKIISNVLKESCTNEELRWYLKDLIKKAKKEVFDDIDEMLDIEWDDDLQMNIFYKSIKQHHLSTFVNKRDIKADKHKSASHFTSA